MKQGHDWYADPGPPYTEWQTWKCAKCGSSRASYVLPDRDASPDCEAKVVEEVQES